MKLALIVGLLLLVAQQAQAVQHHLLIINGIGGTEVYRQQFAELSDSLMQSAIDAGIDQNNILLLTPEPMPPAKLISDKRSIQQSLLEISTRVRPDDRVFVVLIGHGNPRGNSSVFNLPGPDITAEEFAEALTVFKDQALIVINTASASGPFIKALTRENRIVITATSSGREYHAALFGQFFIAAFAEKGADRDKDERISMLEAFDFARHEVSRSFAREKRLATEHALLDDNGDGAGSLDPGEHKEDGALANRIYLQQPRSASTGSSGELIGLLQHKQDIEQSISDLKLQRDSLATVSYYNQLELLLVDLALLARKIRAQGG